MKNILACILLFLSGFAVAQTHEAEFENHGVDSFFLHETFTTVTGGDKVVVIETTFFSDTARLTQFIDELETRYRNMDAEATRLRDDADDMRARIDSIVAQRAIESLSILPFEPPAKPILEVERPKDQQKPDKLRQKAIKPKKIKKKSN